MAEMIDSIRVNGQDYTFTLSSGSNLTISGLTVNGTLVAQNINASGTITGNIVSAPTINTTTANLSVLKTTRIEANLSTGSTLVISSPTLVLSTLSNKKIFYTMSYDSGSKALYITSSNTLGY